MIRGINYEIFGEDSVNTISLKNFMAGFISGVVSDDSEMTIEEAQDFAMEKMRTVKAAQLEKTYGKNKAAGEAYLDSISKKEGIQKLNDSFGNVAGYLRHKITGKGYSYMDGDREVVVKDNESGGILGVLKDEFTESFKNVKDKASNWFSRVSSYFNYGEDDKKEGSDVVTKRKKFIAASVGALAGAGLLA